MLLMTPFEQMLKYEKEKKAIVYQTVVNKSASGPTS